MLSQHGIRQLTSVFLWDSGRGLGQTIL
jgi:hypothetical protein